MDPVDAVERDDDSEAAAGAADAPRDSKRLKKKKKTPAPPAVTELSDERQAEAEAEARADAEPVAAVRRPDPPRAVVAAKAAPAKPSGWPREVVVLGMVLSGIGGALAFNTMPLWNPKGAAALGKGQTVEVTLVAADKTNLACSSATVVDGLHCGFGADGKAWTGEAGSGVLQPFTTTDRKSILGAGLWDDPALKAKLPAKRFKARCDFAPAGDLAAPKVRWSPGAFKDTTNSWPAGRLSNCTLLDG